MKSIDDLNGKVYMTCSACMSVWADGLSWANAHKDRIASRPEDADNIVILSCQVTDLAVLNDLRIIERYHALYPDKLCFISGCLSKRIDVDLPKFAERLETPRKNYQLIHDRSLVNFEAPFWVSNFKENDGKFKQGHLFRDMYPLRIGKGCPNKCTYCTIRTTRGNFTQYQAKALEKEFLAFENVLLVADSPTVEQVKDWCTIADRNNKGFSIRNIEPSVGVRCEAELLRLARKGLLKVYHSPVQSNDPKVLADMHRNVKDTLKSIELARKLKSEGVYIATNIIIDYKGFEQDFSEIYRTYDYVSWNPFWDGFWDRVKAEEKFERYLGSGVENNETLRKISKLEARK